MGAFVGLVMCGVAACVGQVHVWGRCMCGVGTCVGWVHVWGGYICGWVHVWCGCICGWVHVWGVCACLSGFISCQSQEKEAKDEMKRKSKELQMAKREARKEGRTLYTGGFSGGYGSYDNRGGGMNTSVVESLPPPESRTSYNVPR